MSQIVQTPPRLDRKPPVPSPVARYWQIALLALLSLWLYWSTLVGLVTQWWHDPNFSHGFFVPLFSAYVIWQERHRLARVVPRPSWTGLLMIAFGLSMLVVGQLGAELFLARFSLLVVLAGATVFFLGWNYFRAVLFPWAFLILMIPIPTIILNQITFPLQLQASKVSSAILPLFGVPVFREGNIIHLPKMDLAVAEACSGIRSLMSLASIAIIYGYLMERRIWVRWLLAVASLPIAIIANSVRIIGTGLLVQYWDPEKAEGFYHLSWGWIIYVISLALLYALHRLIRVVFREKTEEWNRTDATYLETDNMPRPTGVFAMRHSTLRFILAAGLIAAAAGFLQAHSRGEILPPRLALRTFPEQLGDWQGIGDHELDQDELDVLRPTEYLERFYQNEKQSEANVTLFIAYFASQRTGQTVHSPQNCLPGSGYSPVEKRRVTLSFPGHAPFPANRYVVTKGGTNSIVLYWYWAHNRGVASEYWAKYYLVADSMRTNRSDGSIVRLSSVMYPGESVDAAEQRLLPLASRIMPLLDEYIPR